MNPWADDLDAVDGLVGDGPAAFHAFYDSTVAARAGKESEIPNFKGSSRWPPAARRRARPSLR